MPVKDVGCTYMVPSLWINPRSYFFLGQIISLLNANDSLMEPERSEQLDRAKEQYTKTLETCWIEIPQDIDERFGRVRELLDRGADEKEITRCFSRLRDWAEDYVCDSMPSWVFNPASVAGYAPEILIRQQEPLLSEKVWNALSERATRDVFYASALLTFRMATASAFHILNATEDLLNDYYEHHVAEAERLPRSRRTWGKMERALENLAEKGSVKKRVVQRLADLRENYRNPTFHPQIEYEIDDAVSLFMDCRVAMTRMAEDMAATANN